MTRNRLEKSNCTHKSTHIFYFFCYSLSVTLIEMPTRGRVPQEKNDNVSHNFFVIVPHKGHQLQVLFLQYMEDNGCEFFAWEPVFIYVCHIAPLALRQKEMRCRKKPPASLRKVTKSWLLSNDYSFLTQAFPIWNTCSLSSSQRQPKVPLTQSWNWNWIS